MIKFYLPTTLTLYVKTFSKLFPFPMIQAFQHHPSFWLPQYRHYLASLFLIGLLGELWALSLLFLHSYPPDSLQAFYSRIELQYGIIWNIKVSIIYSCCAAIYSGYILLATALAHFLASRTYLQVAAGLSVLPGLGLLFGLLQIPFSYLIFTALQRQQWKTFLSGVYRRAAEK